jgi:diguanylate cyclase (GGDEF)-like protein/PAS domain S-box-containing protein
MADSLSSYKLWLDNLFDGAYVVDRNRVILYWNKSAENITGYTEAEVLGKSCADNILNHVDLSGCALCMGGCPLQETLLDSQKREAVVFLHHKQGHRVPIHIRVSPIKDENGETTGAIEIFSEHSKNLQIVKELEHHKKESQLDPLLGIGNRRYAGMMFQIRHYDLEVTGNIFGVIFMDIDNFKTINDTYGHSVGDDVLRMVSRSTENVLRHFDVFIRWGGDEFLIYIPNVTTNEELSNVAERIRNLVENSFIVRDDKKISVTVSLGATFIKNDDTLETLVDRADARMYSSKSNGGNRYTIG